MIAIPNIEKPKFCKCEEYNCFAWNDEKYKCKITEWKKPCPIIEIDLVRCGECKQLDHTKWCDFFLHYMNDDDFCSYGERRADDVRHNEQQDF